LWFSLSILFSSSEIEDPFIIHLNFIVTSWYEGVFFVAVIVVAFIFDRQTGSRGYDNIVNNACPCYVVVGFLLMVRSHYLPEKTYRVPLMGYSTYKGNSIYFRFKGHATKRTFSLSGYNLTNICERYDVELYLKEPLPTVYYVCGISLCKRDSISK
jgi:putative lipoprotein